MSETERLTGAVRKLKDGFGFIAGNDGTDYFMHWTTIQSSSERKTFKDLKVGDRVSFTPHVAPKGPRAIDVLVTQAAQ